MKDKDYDYDTAHSSVTVRWEDEDNCDSYLLCLEHYNLKCLKAEPVDENTTEITLYGLAKDLDAFCSDFEDGAIEPLESMSRSLEFDEDYEGWLNNEVWHYKQLMCYAD